MSELVNGVWRYVTNAGMADPGAGLIRTSAAGDQMAISATDKNGGDQHAGLAAIELGATLRAIQRSDATIWAEFVTDAAAIDRGTWIELSGLDAAASAGWAGADGNTDYVVTATNPQVGTGADWITTDDVLAWVGPMADAARLADSTAAAKRYVEDRRSDLDLAGSSDPAPADVHLGAVIYASLIYQAKASPTGYAAYGDGAIDIPGDSQQAYMRAMRLIGMRRPIAI